MRRNHLVTLLALALAGCLPAGDAGSGDDDGPASDRTLSFYYGPMKIMPAETILLSIESVTGHSFGRWDATAPESTSAQFVLAGNGDGQFYLHCRLLGGCLEHRIPLGRTSFVGTAYVLELEKAVTEACYDRSAFAMFPGETAPEASTQAIDVIRYQYRRIFGVVPDDQDVALSLAYFDAHLQAPELTDVSPLESAGRGHCRALLTTNRFLFY